jgi:hypothetical protein
MYKTRYLSILQMVSTMENMSFIALYNNNNNNIKKILGWGEREVGHGGLDSMRTRGRHARRWITQPTDKTNGKCVG